MSRHSPRHRSRKPVKGIYRARKPEFLEEIVVRPPQRAFSSRDRFMPRFPRDARLRAPQRRTGSRGSPRRRFNGSMSSGIERFAIAYGLAFPDRLPPMHMRMAHMKELIKKLPPSQRLRARVELAEMNKSWLRRRRLLNLERSVQYAPPSTARGSPRNSYARMSIPRRVQKFAADHGVKVSVRSSASPTRQIEELEKKIKSISSTAKRLRAREQFGKAFRSYLRRRAGRPTHIRWA